MLKEWAKTYFLNRGVLLGEKPLIEEREDYIVITNQEDKHAIVIVKGDLQDPKPILDRFEQLEKEHKPTHLYLVMYNKLSNIDLIVKAWRDLIKKEKLTLILANPDYNQKWSLSPYIHNKIADIKNLKNGLLSLAGSVELL